MGTIIKKRKPRDKGKSKHDACCIFPVKQAANGFHVKPPVFGCLGIKDSLQWVQGGRTALNYKRIW